MTLSNERARRRTGLLAVCFSLAVLATFLAGPPSGAAETPELVPSTAETVPVQHSGDAMDDPAIWVSPTDPSRSLVLGNDKGGALETYDLDGSLVQRLTVGTQFWGNVDVRQDVTIGSLTGDLVGVTQRGLRFYTVDPATRLLSLVTEGAVPIGVNGEGFCLYESPTTQKVYAFSITIEGVARQFELRDADSDGLLEAAQVRSFAVGSEAEGCVADDDTGALYVSEENVALWRYSAEPDGGTTREAVDVLASAGGHLVNDIEGVTIVDQADGAGFVIVSVQNAPNPNASYVSVYRRGPGNDFVKTVRIVDGTASDDCDRTDGLAASTANLGASFPRGLFVCQDNNNDLPGTSGNQNLKLVRLETVVNLDGGAEPPPPPPPPPGPSSIEFVGQATSNRNSTSFSVPVPAQARAGDGLLLFASQGNTSVLSGPGSGWTQVGRVVDGTHATTVWRRVAAASEAGSTVRMGSGSTFTKVALTLAVYRGTDPTDPVATVMGAPEPGTTTAHTTPRVANMLDGAWRVSYWSDKNNATTRWTAPVAEAVRATTASTGGGRIGTLLSDSGVSLTAGAPPTTGGLTATADAGASSATTWTLLLRPAAVGPPGNQPPVARFSHSCGALVCTFDGTVSTDPDDGIASWAWDFGDGESATEPTTGHTYASAGSYQVSLTVTDDDGATDTVTHPVAVGTTPPPGPLTFVGQGTSNRNSTAVSVQVPPAVQADDALLLFASQGNTLVLGGPGAGWTQIGRVVDGTHATTVWRRVATAADAGSTVRVTSGTANTKVALTLAAYRGTDPVDPVASVSGAGEPGSSTRHATPVVPNTTAGAWRVSYWSDKNSATTRWTPPSGETVRATTTGTGGGRVSSLLTDPTTGLTAGTPATTGGLTATTNAAASTATTWTVLLRPEG